MGRKQRGHHTQSPPIALFTPTLLPSDTREHGGIGSGKTLARYLCKSPPPPAPACPSTSLAYRTTETEQSWCVATVDEFDVG